MADVTLITFADNRYWYFEFE